MEDSALSELLATLETATGGKLDYICGLFEIRRTATLDLDFASTEWDPTGSPGVWRDVEPDADYRKRIVAVVKEAAARMASEPVRHVTVMLDDCARVLDVNGLAPGERVEIGASGTMTLVRGEAGAPHDAVVADGPGAPTKAPTAHRKSDCRGDFIKDPHGILRCSGCCVVAGGLTGPEQTAWLRVRDHAVRVYHDGSFSVGADPSDHVVNDEDRALAEIAELKMSSSVEARAMRCGPPIKFGNPNTPLPRPDGFSQAAVDAAKAALLAPAAKRGAR